MEYNEKKTSAEINGWNSRTAVPEAHAGSATSGGAAARKTEINTYEKANAATGAGATAKTAETAAGEPGKEAAIVLCGTIGNDEKATGEEAENEAVEVTENATGNTSGRVGQNKRKIDREEILRQASEPAMRAEKMADSILHIYSAAEFLTERYVPKDKHSYAAENFQGARPGDGETGGLIDTANETSENAREDVPENTLWDASDFALPGIFDIASRAISDIASHGASENENTRLRDGAQGDTAGRKANRTRPVDSGTGTSASASENAGRTACGASCGREIPPLAVPVDFSTLKFPEESADEPVAPDECRIIILRHAQSLGNAKGSFLGHTDLDLTEQGFVQAEMAADFLDATHVHIDKIYSSDLMRAFHTALPSARRRGLLLSTTKELREVYMGKWEGRVVAELDAEYPEEFSIGWRQHFGTCVLPDGESVPHAARRVYDFVVSRAKENLGKTLMFTSHAAAIRSFWGLALGVPFERMAEEVPFPGNASFSTMIWRSRGQGDGELTPLGFSIDAYLGDLRQTKHS